MNKFSEKHPHVWRFAKHAVFLLGLDLLGAATKYYQVKVNLKNEDQHVPTNYIEFSGPEKTQTVAEALKDTPIDTSDWTIFDKIEYCDLQQVSKDDYDFDRPANRWLTARANEVADAMLGNKKREPIVAVFTPCSTFNARAYESTGRDIIFVNKRFDQETIKILKLTISHEIEHTTQKNMDIYWQENDADIAVAKTFGPEAEVEQLRRLESVHNQHFYDLVGEIAFYGFDLHGTEAQREGIIRKVFPRPQQALFRNNTP